jgi:uncharacterized protein YchJ
VGLLNAGRAPAEIMRLKAGPGHVPARNEPCSCGSGRKFKHCCARVN